jgi:hypothetical protein
MTEKSLFDSQQDKSPFLLKNHQTRRKGHSATYSTGTGDSLHDVEGTGA